MSTPRIIAIVIFLITGVFGGGFFIHKMIQKSRNPDLPWKPWPFLGIMFFDGVFMLVMWYAFVFMEPPTDFMRALKADDLEAAYALLTPDLQDELGSEVGFREWAAPVVPQRWFFASGCSSGGWGRIDGRGRFEDGEKFTVTFHVQRTADGWLIQGITFWNFGIDHWIGKSSGLDCSD